MSGKETIRQQLSAHLDGELSGSEAERVERAVREDAELAGELAELRAVRRLVGDLPRRRVPDDFARRVLSQAERRHLVGADVDRGPARRFRWVRHLAAAVLLVAASVGVIVVATLWNLKTTPHKIAHTGLPADKLARGPDPTGRDMAGASLSDDRRRGHGRLEDMPEGTFATKLGARGARRRPVTKDGGAPGPGPGPKPGGRKDTSGPVPERGGDRYGRSSGRAGGARGVGDGSLGVLPGTLNEMIFTADLADARRDVERLLNKLDIDPVVVEAPNGTDNRPPALGRRNFYQASKIAEDQFQYVVFVTPKQMSQLHVDLKNIRLRQGVSQELEVAGREFRAVASVTKAGPPADKLAVEELKLNGRTPKHAAGKVGQKLGEDAAKAKAAAGTVPVLRPAKETGITNGLRQKAGNLTAQFSPGAAPATQIATGPAKQGAETAEAVELSLDEKQVWEGTATAADDDYKIRAGWKSEGAGAAIAMKRRGDSRSSKGLADGEPTGQTPASQASQGQAAPPVEGPGQTKPQPRKTLAQIGKGTEPDRDDEGDKRSWDLKDEAARARRGLERFRRQVESRLPAGSQSAFAEVLPLLITLQYRTAPALSGRAVLKAVTTRNASRLEKTVSESAPANEASKK